MWLQEMVDSGGCKMSTTSRNSYVRFSLDGHRGKKVKFTSSSRACGIPLTKRAATLNHFVRTGPKQTKMPRKVTTGISRQHKFPNRMCACGDGYCNYISRFLGTVITKKCSYVTPDKGNSNANKQLRSEKIYQKLTRFRKVRNDLFKTQVLTEPPQNTRFNEIHYSMLFLRSIKAFATRIPLLIDVELAKETNMFKKDLVGFCRHKNKKRVVVVPTLNTHQAIQVHYVMINTPNHFVTLIVGNVCTGSNSIQHQV